MPLRTDIYPLPEAQKHLEALTIRTQEALPTLFPKIDDLVAYVNNFKNPKIAGLFLEIGNYYHAAKQPPFTTIIMTLTVFEKLSAVETSGVADWVDFHDWVSRKDVDTEYRQVLRKGLFRDFTALMDSLKGKWSKEFGGTTKVTNFLRTTMTPQEKQALIKTIKYLQAAPELPNQNQSGTENATEAALPACFEPRQHQKCYTTLTNKNCTQTSCPLLADKDKLDKNFKDTIKTLYEWRTRFVYDAQMPPQTQDGFYGVHYRGKYVLAELSTDEFKPVFERVIKRFFDNYQSLPSKNKHKKH